MQTLAAPADIQMKPVRHRGEARITLRFPFDRAVIREVRALPDARWSATMKCWQVPDTAESNQKIDDSSLPVHMLDRTARKDIEVQEPTKTESPQQTGTTVGVPTPGALSGISSPKEEPSALPQPDTQGAADILVTPEQGTPEIHKLLEYKYLKTTFN